MNIYISEIIQTAYVFERMPVAEKIATIATAIITKIALLHFLNNTMVISTTTSNTGSMKHHNSPPKTTQSQAVATDQEELLTQLVPLFNEYQKYCIQGPSPTENTFAIDGDDEDSYSGFYVQKLQFRTGLVQKILTMLNVFETQSEMSNLSISGDDGGVKRQNFVGELATFRQSTITHCFIHLMDSAVASLLTKETSTVGKCLSSGSGNMLPNGNTRASAAILELVVAAATESVVVGNKKLVLSSDNDILDHSYSCCHGICSSVLSHLIKYSECNLDIIRVVAIRSLCTMAECLGSEINTEIEQERLELLDTIQQALLPRFTDKAVAVRCAVVQACFPTFSPSLSFPNNPLQTDPDILQAMQWIVQHDSSPNNRMIAIQHAPINRASIEYVIPRIRDTKVNVRTSVIAAISTSVQKTMSTNNSIEPTNFILPSRHMADLVTAGYTDR
jgi:hypothetical protein